METQGESAARLGLAARIEVLRGLDTSHTCQMRLLALRTRIEGNWPSGRTLFGRSQRFDNGSRDLIADLLIALPTPLPIHAGADPEPIISITETDLRAVAGRAVDAGLALLDGYSLEALYPGEVTMLESRRPGALDAIRIANPSVGLLVATIIGTLEAVAEAIGESGPKAPAADRKAARTGKQRGSKGPDDDGREPKPDRGRVVPRI